VQGDTIRVVGYQVKITPTQTSMLPSITSAASTHKRTETQQVHVSVIDTAGTPMPYKTVVLSLVPTSGSGHVHSITSPAKPAGVIPTIVNTGIHGDTLVNYSSPDPSGTVWIKGRSSGAGSVQKKVKIEVLGLALYGSEIGADMVGSKPSHPDNHWATPSHIEGLAGLAEVFTMQFPTAARLKYNDSSIQFGGLFDFGVNWQAPHLGHRLGHETDLQTYKSCDGQQNCDCHAQDPILTAAQLNTVKATWLALAEYGASIKDHKKSDMDVCPHWHLILP
jgi:hypothetical protein